MLVYFSTAFLFAISSIAQAVAPASPAPEPSSTAPAVSNAPLKIPVHLTSVLSSHDAQTGQKFSFIVADDVLSGGVVVIPKCTAGSGTVLLAGKHGINGHEGNLHLRFDALTQADGTVIALDPKEQDFAGKDRKALAFFTTRWLNGDDVEVKPDQVLEVTAAGDTPHMPATPPACPVPSATPAAQ